MFHYNFKNGIQEVSNGECLSIYNCTSDSVLILSTTIPRKCSEVK